MDNYFIENDVLFSKGYDSVKNTHPVIIGCGGLGGYVAHGLTRLGVKTLTLIDPDTFEKRNLNRQLFSSQSTLGKHKVDVLKSNLKAINPELVIHTYNARVETVSLNTNYTMLIDCVDTVDVKLYLEQLATKLKLPLLHGAIGGWFGQLGFILPDTHLLKNTYDDSKETLEKQFGSPTFTPGVIAHLMVAEYAKYYTDNSSALINQLLLVDLNTMTLERLYKK